MWNLLARNLLRCQPRHFATKVIVTPYMADSITQGTLASWEKSTF